MTKIILRLDDACPVMNHDNWNRIEELLDQYGVKPIVGIIPENRDDSFTWYEDPGFWNVTAKRWERKGWCIAQHGCYHLYKQYIDDPNAEANPLALTEFNGLPKDRQRELIETGYNIMSGHGIKPEGFFAPNHTFDDNTVDVLRESGHFAFISDGLSFDLYKYRGMVFIPYIPAARKLPVKPRMMTRILHPNIMSGNDISEFGKWLNDNRQYLTTAPELLSERNDIGKKSPSSGILRLYLIAIRLAIFLYGKLRK
jgi:predicted deacetylase